MLLAAVEQGSGVILGQSAIDSKSNEIPAFRALARELDLAGRVVTGDALHAQQETARCLLDDCGAEYLITAVKENQPTMLEDLRGMDFSACPMVETLDKEHGRIELRRYWVKDLSGGPHGTAMPTCTDAAKPSASNASGSTSRPARPAPR